MVYCGSSSCKCLEKCKDCAKILCTNKDLYIKDFEEDNAFVCSDCILKCSFCKNDYRKKHLIKCSLCDLQICPFCQDSKETKFSYSETFDEYRCSSCNNQSCIICSKGYKIEQLNMCSKCEKGYICDECTKDALYKNESVFTYKKACLNCVELKNMYFVK